MWGFPYYKMPWFLASRSQLRCCCLIQSHREFRYEIKMVGWEEDHGRDYCGRATTKERDGNDIDVNVVWDGWRCLPHVAIGERLH